jgi:hypothetical protein
MQSRTRLHSQSQYSHTNSHSCSLRCKTSTLSSHAHPVTCSHTHQCMTGADIWCRSVDASGWMLMSTIPQCYKVSLVGELVTDTCCLPVLFPCFCKHHKFIFTVLWVTHLTEVSLGRAPCWRPRCSSFHAFPTFLGCLYPELTFPFPSPKPMAEAPASHAPLSLVFLPLHHFLGLHVNL